MCQVQASYILVNGNSQPSQCKANVGDRIEFEAVISFTQQEIGQLFSISWLYKRNGVNNMARYNFTAISTIDTISAFIANVSSGDASFQIVFTDILDTGDRVICSGIGGPCTSITVATVTEGILHLSSTPPAADVYINNVLQPQKTPIIVELLPGSYSYRLELTGYEIHRGNFNITSGQTTTIDVELVALQLTGSLQLISNPTGAQIFLDGDYTGHSTNITLSDIPVGIHTVTLRLEGYQEKTFEADIISDQTATINVTLDPIESGTGSVKFFSNPVGAHIWIGEDDKGATIDTGLLVTNLQPGILTFTAKLEGYQDKTDTVTVVADTTTNKIVTLTSIAQAGIGGAGILLMAGLAIGAIYMATRK